MVRIQVGQHDHAEVFGPYAHGLELFRRRHAFRDIWMVKRSKLRRKMRGGRLCIVRTRGAYFPAQSGIHQHKAMRMLDQVAAYRQGQTPAVRGQELPGRVFEIDAIAEGRRLVEPYIAAMEHMELHDPFPSRFLQFTIRGAIKSIVYTAA